MADCSTGDEWPRMVCLWPTPVKPHLDFRREVAYRVIPAAM